MAESGDHLDHAATQVRSGTRGDRVVHKLLCAQTRDGAGRQYRTQCHRYLYANQGAVLTTVPADCRDCTDVLAPAKARVSA